MKQYIICVFSFLIYNTMTAQTNTGTRLNHIAVQVTDLAASTRFYQQVVGLDTIPEPFHDGKHTWFAIGPGAALHLIQADSKPIVPGKNTHFCFSVASVEEFVKTLNKYKVPFENWPGEAQAITTRTDGVKQIYFKDPDGYWIEVNDSKE